MSLKMPSAPHFGVFGLILLGCLTRIEGFNVERNGVSIAKPSFIQTKFNLRGLGGGGGGGQQGGGPPSDFRGTIGNLISGVATAVAPNSCIGELMMTGYSNDLYNEDDYPFQPSCYNGGAANRLECFPGTATVVTQDIGVVSMDELQIGQNILTIDPITHTPTFKEVLLFLHRDPNRESDQWVKIEHQQGHLTLSSMHMLLANPKGNSGLPLSIAAHKVKSGDILSVYNTHGEVVDSTVTSVASPHISLNATASGIYAPVTETGSLFVDGVLASSYSSLGMLGSLERHAHVVFDYAAIPLKQLAKRRRLMAITSSVLHMTLNVWNQFLSAVGYRTTPVKRHIQLSTATTGTPQTKVAAGIRREGLDHLLGVAENIYLHARVTAHAIYLLFAK